MLAELADRYKDWGPTTTVGDILLKHVLSFRLESLLNHQAPSLKIYTEFSNNYEQVPKALDSLYEIEWFQNAAPNRYEMTSMLIQPVQRLPRYLYPALSLD